MPNGYFALVLHAHLPFVRHPEDPTVMEEQWLYEAITGTYLPLLQVFEGLIADRVPYRCTVSLSAPLITMLTDDLLKERYAAHLDKLIELAGKEIDRTRPERHYQRLAQMYPTGSARCATPGAATGRSGTGVPQAEEAGRVEVITSTATHAFFPMMDRNWAACAPRSTPRPTSSRSTSAAARAACGSASAASSPASTSSCARRASATSSSTRHGILYADGRRAVRRLRPALLSDRRGRLRRDTESSEQVWSAKEGYPGDPALPRLLSRHRLRPAHGLHRARTSTRKGIRMYTGIKYHAITHNKLHDKWVYDPDMARGRVGLHASPLPRQPREAGEALAGRWTGPPSW